MVTSSGSDVLEQGTGSGMGLDRPGLTLIYRLAAVPAARLMVIQNASEIVRHCWRLWGFDREQLQVIFETTLENGSISRLSAESMRAQGS